MSDDVLEQLRQQERETVKRIDELQAEIADLTDQRRKLHRAIVVLDNSAKSHTSHTGVGVQVLKLLRESDHPLRVRGIAEELALDILQVRSAVGYLKHKGQASNVQQGLWVAETVAPARPERVE